MKRSLSIMYIRVKYEIEVIPLHMIFFQVAMDIINTDEGQEPQNMNECRLRHDRLQWKEAIQTELKSLS